METHSDKGIFAAFFLTIIVGVLYFYGAHLVAEKNILLAEKIAQVPHSFSDITLLAKSAEVIDLDSGTPIFTHHIQKVLPLASITKLATMQAIVEKISPDESVTITKTAMSTDGDNGLLLGEKWNVGELLKFSLLVSSNDGIMALRELYDGDDMDENHSLLSAINAKAKNLGLNSLSFLDESGLDIEKVEPGAQGTVSDAILLLSDTYEKYPEYLEPTTHAQVEFTSQDGFIHVAENTNDAAEQISGLIAGKTGFTDLAGGNLVILVQTPSGRKLGIGVLGSTLNGRFEDIRELATAGTQYMDAIQSLGLAPYFPF